MTPADLAAKGLRVKPLVWDDYDGESSCTSTLGEYLAEYHDDMEENSWGMWSPDESAIGSEAHSWYPTLEAAKAAAEADHAARIAAMIEETPHDQT
jgi:hypothetical protein